MSSSGMNLSGKQGLELKTESKESSLKLKVLLKFSNIFGFLRSSIFNISGIDSFDILFPTLSRVHTNEVPRFSTLASD